MFLLRCKRRFFFLLQLGMAVCASTVAHAQRDSLVAVVNSDQSDSLRLQAILELTASIRDSTDLQWIDTGRNIIRQYRGEHPAWLKEAAVELCLNEAYYYFSENINYGQAVSMTQTCLESARQLQHHGLIGRAYNNIGIIYYSMGRSDDCLENIREALHHRRLAGEPDAMVQATANMGFILFKTGLIDQSLDYLYDALRMADSMQNFERKGIALHYLGQVYQEQGSYQRMLEIARESLELFSRLDDRQRLASGYNNVGSAYDKLDQPDSAMHYYRAALSLRREGANTYGIANSLHNIGYLHFRQKDYNSSLQYLREAIQLWEQINNIEGLVTSANHIAQCFLAVGRADSALRYAGRAYEMAAQGDLSERKESRRLKAEAYERLGQSAKALEAYKTYMELSAMLFNEENTRLAEQKALSYEFDKRESALRAEEAQKQAVLTEQLKGQRRSRNLILTALVLSILSAALLYNRYQLKRRAEKALMLKNKQVEAARERAEESEAFRKRFLANMSHEIRTPMSAVIGLSRLLKDTPLNTEQSRYVHAVHHSAANLMTVLNDILDISKIEAGKLELHTAPFSVADELEWLEETFLPKAEEKGLELAISCDETVPELLTGDASRLVQVLTNLLHNAIKFTEKGKISLEVKATDKGVCFTVRDTGIGIASEKLPGLFESFTQAHSEDNRRYGGTGLGLTIASELVGRMGGKLQAESKPGNGSVFSFTLPLPPADNVAVTDLPERSLQVYPAAGIRVLLAEDDPYNAIVTTETLKKYFPGIVVTHVPDGKAALDSSTSVQFDIILMDVQMPEMDGYETTRHLRAKQVHIPVIALTASVIRADLECCFAAGMNDYIAKPFMEEDFVRVVSRWAGLQDAGENNTPGKSVSASGRALFFQLAPERLSLLRAAIRAGDVEEMRRMVHLLKPQLADAGMDILHPFFVRVENPGEKDNRDAVLENAAKLADHIADHIQKESADT